MRIAIIGAGGVGGYFGAQLAASGEDVVFIARGAHLEVLRRDGLRVESEHAPAHVFPVNATDVIEEVGPVDLALVGVKRWDTDEVGRRLAPHLSRDSTVLSLQNGVSKDDILRGHLPASALIGGVCYISAAIASPGLIRHDGSLSRVILGEFDGQRSERALRIFERFTRAGVDAELSTSISEMIWEKVVFLVGLSSVTSATRQPVGILRRRERTRRLLRDTMAEVVRVGRARGIRLLPTTPTNNSNSSTRCPSVWPLPCFMTCFAAAASSCHGWGTVWPTWPARWASRPRSTNCWQQCWTPT